ncbi:MAG: Bug family tripartite tricarboxylate transporter substrate binding protein [Beijerinckiaceae bacterium]
MRAKAQAAGAAALAFTAIGLGAAAADPVADFYKGKTMSMVISSGAGGGYDALSRTISRHIGKHIPGNPNVVPRNMPGAGGIVATKHLYSSAARDGTVIGGVQNNAPLEPLFGTKEADYDSTKLNWIGTPSLETGLLIVWHTSKFKTIDDVRHSEMTAGASGVNSAPAFYSRLLNELLGTKIKVIAGYPGQNDAYIAIERGELDTYGVTFWSSLTSTKQNWLKNDLIRILVQYGPVKEAALKDVPYGPDLVKNEEDKLLFEAAYGPLTLGRPFLMPPDIPAERLAAVRKAFMEMIKDPAFRDEAEKLGLQIDNPRSGEQLQADIERLYRTPPQVVERLRRIAQNK